MQNGEETLDYGCTPEVSISDSKAEDAADLTMHGNLVYDMVEDEPEEDLLPDPEVYEAARRIDEERWFYRFVKRVFDITFSATVLILFCWLYALIAIAIKIDDPKGSVIFKQERVGKNGERFMMWKFRSMYVDAESQLDRLMTLNEKTGPVFKIARDPRITRVGRIIRKLSLASVIIGTPGAGEPTNSLSSAAKTSFDQQFYDRRPEVSPATQSIIPAPNSCLFTFFGGSRKAQYELEARADGADQGGSPWRGKASSSMIEKGAYCLTPALGVAA